jgi:hypothetical protein
MKKGGGNSSQTFAASGSKGSTGSPIPKGGAQIGNSAEGKPNAPTKSPITKGGIGLERAAKGGSNISAKSQPTVHGGKQAGIHREGFSPGGAPKGRGGRSA